MAAISGILVCLVTARVIINHQKIICKGFLNFFHPIQNTFDSLYILYHLNAFVKPTRPGVSQSLYPLNIVYSKHSSLPSEPAVFNGVAMTLPPLTLCSFSVFLRLRLPVHTLRANLWSWFCHSCHVNVPRFLRNLRYVHSKASWARYDDLTRGALAMYSKPSCLATSLYLSN